MKVERLPADYSKDILSGISDAAQAMQDARSPGLHVSTIIRSIMTTIQPKRFASQGDDGPPIEWTSAGTLWEYVLELAMAKLAIGSSLIRPGEIEKDGIILTPDAVSVTDWIVHEFKFTWMSSRDALEHVKFKHWEIQLKAYCHALGANRARLHGFFVMGDYKGSGPQPLAWDITFSHLELIENWEMLVNHAKDKGWLK